jgi:general stress protein 26
MSSPEHKAKIWNLIKDIKVGMLVTEQDGFMHARPMQLVQDDYDGTLYFYTKAHSGKTEEIKKDHDVCITFADTDKQNYISLTGIANLTHDQNLIDKYWNSVIAAWFPEGKDSDEVAMLAVKINKGEHWDGTSNPVSFFYEIAKANIQDEEPDVGEHQKFG